MIERLSKSFYSFASVLDREISRQYKFWISFQKKSLKNWWDLIVFQKRSRFGKENQIRKEERKSYFWKKSITAKLEINKTNYFQVMHSLKYGPGPSSFYSCSIRRTRILKCDCKGHAPKWFLKLLWRCAHPRNMKFSPFFKFEDQQKQN